MNWMNKLFRNPPPSPLRSANTFYYYRVVTTETGKFAVQKSCDMAKWEEEVEATNTIYGEHRCPKIYRDLVTAKYEVDRLIRCQYARLEALRNAGRVMYGPLPDSDTRSY